MEHPEHKYIPGGKGDDRIGNNHAFGGYKL